MKSNLPKQTSSKPRRLIVDGATGDDLTGKRGCATLPFKTIVAANRASRPGDMILILFGPGCNEAPIIAWGRSNFDLPPGQYDGLRTWQRFADPNSQP